MKTSKLWQLFLATFYLSAFTFGGGYVIVSLMKQKFVDELKWIDDQEMLDLIAIAQSAPGAIAVNGAIIIGYKLAGILGVLVAVIATILPPLVIIITVSIFYEVFKANEWIRLMLEGMEAGVAAVISSVTFEMASGIIEQKSLFLMTIMVTAFIASYFFNISVVIIMIICIGLGLIRSVIYQRRVAQ